MGREVEVPWIGVSKDHGEGGSKYHGKEIKIPWVVGSTYHGKGAQNISDRGSKYHE